MCRQTHTCCRTGAVRGAAYLMSARSLCTERVALHRSAVCVHVHAVPVHVGFTCTHDGPVLAGDDEPEAIAEVDRGCGSQAPQGDVDVR